jgi:hypothetical protein
MDTVAGRTVEAKVSLPDVDRGLISGQWIGLPVKQTVKEKKQHDAPHVKRLYVNSLVLYHSALYDSTRHPPALL